VLIETVGDDEKRLQWRPSLPNSAIGWLWRALLLLVAWFLAYMAFFTALFAFDPGTPRSFCQMTARGTGALAYLAGGMWGALSGDWILTFLLGSACMRPRCSTLTSPGAGKVHRNGRALSPRR
jgi:hypothetical protein